MKTFRLLCCLALLLCGQIALAWDRPAMSKYGAFYQGPEQLVVQLAHTAADDHAVLKISGINHPWDGRVFWVEVRYQPGHTERIYYVSKEGDDERILLYVEDGNGGELSLPDWRGSLWAQVRINYQRYDSREVLPEHLATDYERQIGQVK
ncbi:MAG: hypothetical protein LBJ59_04755 [Zoogloeaceae bacterium]|jgi:hypothetical protein|nr:hypothetical protein [Zoogloeaceae bacterium]